MPQIHHFLAIETSGNPGSVAVGTANGSSPHSPALATHTLPASGSQGRDLMPLVVHATSTAGWSLEAVDLVAVAIGPGPFTGLRVGVTTAKAIAWSADCQIIGVPTAACLATQAAEDLGRPNNRVDVVFDAGRGEAFVITAIAVDAEEFLVWQLSPGSLFDPATWIDGLPTDAVITGPGLDSASELLSDLTGRRPDLLLASVTARQPTAATVARLGLAAASRGEDDSAAALKPIYLRPSYAEDRSSAKH